jgi:hypothetical protein
VCPAGAVLDGLRKSVLLEAQQGETVVAAIEFPQRVREPRGVDAGHFADVGVEIDAFECTGGQPRALLMERCQRLAQSAADAAGRGESFEHERRHVALTIRPMRHAG